MIHHGGAMIDSFSRGRIDHSSKGVMASKRSFDRSLEKLSDASLCNNDRSWLCHDASLQRRDRSLLLWRSDALLCNNNRSWLCHDASLQRRDRSLLLWRSDALLCNNNRL
uniref:Recombination protein n=1 Tax=Jaagichlorella roystonensis TaxID=1052852 RepID=A0A6C0M5Q4_9CHLO|nr:recombination protein [Jaagichlorella roystonensis]YP_009733050.1 recombination protein [Jaagichlorella roystonensis]QHU78302.1 recombination protein [Jaagichlorella roystonensis]QHU78346.1 recombination protein [Jaagichlorella roystonensis]